MKIEAKDLRIGNWVESNSKNFAIKSFDITNVVKGFVCQGIPLTPEILEKAGFEDMNTSPKRYEHYDLASYLTKHDKGYIYSGVSYPIIHVHTLQNVFHSLTGSELIINL